MNKCLDGIYADAKLVQSATLDADPAFADAAAEFLRIANQIGPYDDYKKFPASLHTLLAGIGADFGAAGLRRFLRHVIARAVCLLLESDRFRALPPLVAHYHTVQLARIAADSNYSAEWLDIAHDLFQKEFGIATLRLYAVGAQLVDYRCGIPRSVIWQGGAAHAVSTGAKIVGAGGFRPYFQIHTHQFMLEQFTPAGWDACYLCCVELYDVHPNVRGMFGSSWFYDPALDQASPRLAYLREVPISGGAHLFLWERGGSAVDLALSTSQTRRHLYDAGLYFPTSYMMMWPRKQQREWAARRQA